jgi:hypothetical protein
MKNKNKWVPFYFEGNQAWGWIKTKEDWQRIKKAYADDSTILGSAKRNDRNKDRPSFGFYAEYRGTETLKEFTDKNNMDIS